MLSWLADIARFPALLLDLAANAMIFAPSAFERAAHAPEAQTAALVIAFLAGVSEMLGQSVILVVNRVALYRFLASLLFTGATYVVTALTWAACALGVAAITRTGALMDASVTGVTGIVFLAFAPRLLGVFSIAPYFGAAFGNLLESWAMLLAIFGLHVSFGLPFGAAIFCGGAGWAVSYGLRVFFGHMLAKPLGRLRLFVSGSPLDRSPQQIIDDVMHVIRGEARR